eukprot:scaffold201940_cov31-Tisochrysis_lutea.AAC.3
MCEHASPAHIPFWSSASKTSLGVETLYLGVTLPVYIAHFIFILVVHLDRFRCGWRPPLPFDVGGKESEGEDDDRAMSERERER